MKVVILAGGMGTRLQEETHLRPKPMVEIGGKPILWHIMKHYAEHNFSDFYIALGYLGDHIKNFFLSQYNLSGSLAIDFKNNNIERREHASENWRVNMVETGIGTMTGGRLLRLKKQLGDETLMITYGDGVSDVNLTDLLQFHRSHGRIATMTAVRPPARFGGLSLDGDVVESFTEKPVLGEGWINGGFMVLEPQVFDYLDDDQSILESMALERLASESQLMAYRHSGFWQCMDTMRDKNYLQNLWDTGNPPWKTWTSECGIRLYAA